MSDDAPISAATFRAVPSALQTRAGPSRLTGQQVSRRPSGRNAIREASTARVSGGPRRPSATRQSRTRSRVSSEATCSPEGSNATGGKTPEIAAQRLRDLLRPARRSRTVIEPFEPTATTRASSSAAAPRSAPVAAKRPSSRANFGPGPALQTVSPPASTTLSTRPLGLNASEEIPPRPVRSCCQPRARPGICARRPSRRPRPRQRATAGGRDRWRSARARPARQHRTPAGDRAASARVPPSGPTRQTTISPDSAPFAATIRPPSATATVQPLWAGWHRRAQPPHAPPVPERHERTRAGPGEHTPVGREGQAARTDRGRDESTGAVVLERQQTDAARQRAPCPARKRR